MILSKLYTNFIKSNKEKLFQFIYFYETPFLLILRIEFIVLLFFRDISY